MELDCPPWEYEHHPDRNDILAKAAKLLLLSLKLGQLDTIECTADTRRIHERLFSELTPPGFQYYAGHYRGQSFPCLENRFVGILADPRVGCPPGLVCVKMSDLATLIKTAVPILDMSMRLPNAQLPMEEKLLNIVAVACRVFEMFLRIHPYLNGNGHAARFILVAILGRYGYWLSDKFKIDPRPDGPYITIINQYRDGNPFPLERFILSYLER